jgi:5-methylcytosine-specific restriction enzyme A
LLCGVAVSGWKHDRRSRHERGYGTAWTKLREQAMRRDMWLCQPCRKAGRTTAATECDHITPKAKGGKDELSNLQAICQPCHAAKTAVEVAEAQGRATQTRLTFDAAGWPIWPEGR